MIVIDTDGTIKHIERPILADLFTYLGTHMYFDQTTTPSSVFQVDVDNVPNLLAAALLGESFSGALVFLDNLEFATLQRKYDEWQQKNKNSQS